MYPLSFYLFINILLYSTVTDFARFLGWSTNAEAAVPEYRPGDSFHTDGDLTLYAVWKLINPPTLIGEDFSMITGETRDWRDYVTLNHDGTVSFTLVASVSGDAVRLDDSSYQVMAVSAGAAVLTVYVKEYPAASCSRL